MRKLFMPEIIYEGALEIFLHQKPGTSLCDLYNVFVPGRQMKMKHNR
jgi:hypothetical protein